MNAKEQIINILKLYNDEYEDLITAVEAAIFDVPSEMFSKRDVERAIFEFANGDRNLSEIERRDIAINFIINKKTESDGK